ncbi:MAG: hypothetical protein CMO01_13525 [Thalassobius sp.]|nr:hypothetical protein [Thalassovita sp.]
MIQSVQINRRDKILFGVSIQNEGVIYIFFENHQKIGETYLELVLIKDKSIQDGWIYATN